MLTDAPRKIHEKHSKNKIKTSSLDVILLMISLTFLCEMSYGEAVAFLHIWYITAGKKREFMENSSSIRTRSYGMLPKFRTD